MAAIAKLHQAANRVCAQIERGWTWRLFPPPYLRGRYECDALEKRQLLSVAANISGPSVVTEGDGYVLNLTASSTASTYTVQNWIINYGDGTTHTLIGDSVADLYTYNTPSSPTYDITATVFDTEGGASYSASTSMSVEVDEATASLYLSPDQPVVGQEFDLYQELSDGGAHTLSAYSVSWGDGSSDSDSTTPEPITSGYADDFTHTYSAAGTYDLTGTAVTEQGTVTATASVVAEPISLEAPTDGYVAGQEYDLTPTFNDPGHTLSSYVVSWGDGSSDATYDASAASFSYTYAAGGQNPYEITVQAVADDGTWTAYAEADPLAVVWADNGTTVDRGDTVNLDGSFDANGDDPTAWVVDWGDGTTATYNGSNVEGFNDDAGGPLGATHTYTSDGDFNVTAIAYDTAGSYTAQSSTVEVDEPTPTFSVSGNDEFTKGQEYDLTPSFTISSGDTPDDYYVDWGDGSGESTYSGSSTNLAHTYTTGTPYSYNINATVTTDYGTYTASTSVDEVPPGVSISGPDSVTAGQTASFTTEFDDPNGNTPTAWTVYWGDGDEGQVFSGDPAYLTHVYTAAPESDDDWTVMAMASEIDGNFWADDATVAVTNDDPVVSVTPSATPTAGLEFSLEESFSDPAGRTPLNWVVNWGDDAYSDFDNGGNPELIHYYTLPGNYQIDATAVVAPIDPQDPMNQSYSTTLPIVVSDAGVLDIGVNAMPALSESEATLTFFDPDGVTPTSYAVDWGDGINEQYGTETGGTFTSTYATPGDYTVTGTASTVEGDFTATESVYVDPPNYQLAVVAPGNAESGQPYPVACFWGPDQAGNLTNTFPIPSLDVDYSINWGDGSTQTGGATLVFTHDYTYQPQGNNGYDITVIATIPQEGITVGSGAYANVEPAGSGHITIPDAPDEITEGIPFTLSGAAFSDDDQPEGYQGCNWTVFWGDGDSSSENCVGPDAPTFAVSHEYAEPGQYLVTFVADYQEADQVFPFHTTIGNPMTISVAEKDPTLTATESTDQLTDGDVLTVFPTYTDTVGDHVTGLMTVNWGDDSQESTYVGPGEPGGEITHVYATPGTYTPLMQIAAYKDYDGITATLDAIVVSEPTLSITAINDVADEDGQQPAEFLVTRTGTDFQTPQFFGFTMGGTIGGENNGINAAWGPFAIVADGRINGGNVTMGVGESVATIDVYPLEDHTPRWTEALDITLGASGGAEPYTVNPTASAAGCYIESDDLYAWLDDGSDNDVFEGGDPSDGGSLVPLTLELPEEERDGAVITLIDNNPYEADVYPTSDPGPGATPILGDVDGTYVSTVAWTYGVDDDAPSGKTTFGVEAISGSSSLNDFSFEIQDSDAGCGPGGTNKNPTVPQNANGDPVHATTTVSAPSNGATGVTVEIVSLNDPNPDDISGVVTDETRNWLVGQVVDLEVGVQSPFPSTPLGVRWHIDGGAGDNVLYDYSDNANAASETHLLFDNGGTGLNDQRIKFFWVAADSLGDASATHTVSVTVVPQSLYPSGFTNPVSTSFDVFEPPSSMVIAQQGATSPGFQEAGSQQWWVALGSPGMGIVPPRPGIKLTASVQSAGEVTDLGGQWKFIQLATINGSRTETNANGQFATKHLSASGLDLDDPYNIINQASYPGLAVFPTGDVSESMTDSPETALGQPGNYVSAGTYSRAYTSFLMFLPPSGTDASKWVPLQFVTWEWNFSVSIPNDQRISFMEAVVNNPAPVGPNAQGPIAALIEPTWSLRVQDHLTWS